MTTHSFTETSTVGDGEVVAKKKEERMLCKSNKLLLAVSVLAFANVNAQVLSPFITSDTLSTANTAWGTVNGLRSNYTGCIGFEFRVSSPIVVWQLGRWVLAGNSQAHTLLLSDPSGNTLGLTSLATAGQTAGSFAYSDLPAPIVLLPGTYVVSSQETYGGDQWYDGDTSVVSTSVGSVLASVWSTAPCGAINTGGSTSGAYSFVPVNFTYSTALSIQFGPGLTWTSSNSVINVVPDSAVVANLTVPQTFSHADFHERAAVIRSVAVWKYRRCSG